MTSCVACCKKKPLWAACCTAGALLLVCVVWLAKRGPSAAQADAAPAQQAAPQPVPALTWHVATGDGLPAPTRSHSISLGNNPNAPAWGPGKVTVQLPGGRTIEYAVDALWAFEVTGIGPEVRLRFPKQPLASALPQAKALLADWNLANEPFYLDRWHAKRAAAPENARSTVWVSTMGSRVPAMVTLVQPKREEDQWSVVLQVFPKRVR
jgi:hypothetical protein